MISFTIALLGKETGQPNVCFRPSINSSSCFFPKIKLAAWSPQATLSNLAVGNNFAVCLKSSREEYFCKLFSLNSSVPVSAPYLAVSHDTSFGKNFQYSWSFNPSHGQRKPIVFLKRLILANLFIKLSEVFCVGYCVTMTIFQF